MADRKYRCNLVLVADSSTLAYSPAIYPRCEDPVPVLLNRSQPKPQRWRHWVPLLRWTIKNGQSTFLVELKWHETSTPDHRHPPPQNTRNSDSKNENTEVITDMCTEEPIVLLTRTHFLPIKPFSLVRSQPNDLNKHYCGFHGRSVDNSL